jgi:hypothetical protein
MRWFFTVLLQWMLIATIVVIAMVVGNIYVAAFAAIVVIGLYLYGFANPAFMVRRTIVWSASAIVASHLIPEIPVDLVVTHLTPRLPSWAVDLVKLGLQVLNGHASPWIMVPLVVLAAVEIAIIRTRKPSAPDTRLSVGRPYGAIVRPTARPETFYLDHTLFVSNKTSAPLSISRATLRLHGFASEAPAELYESGKPDQISDSSPLVLQPNTSNALDLVCRNPGGLGATIIGLAVACRIGRLLEFKATAALYGDIDTLQSRLALTYKLTDRPLRR